MNIMSLLEVYEMRRDLSRVIEVLMLCNITDPGLLIGCGKKRKILRHFQGKLCGKKGPLCGKLCDFFKADLTLFY